jgi:RNA polymerase sigma-70 factor, ECF subfamily
MSAEQLSIDLLASTAFLALPGTPSPSRPIPSKPRVRNSPMARTADELSDLLTSTAGGDTQAFEAVYDRTSAKLYGIILRILRRRDLADEVLQEVYVKIWERAGDFDSTRASPITWMSAIARNRALDEVRKRTPVSIEDTPEALNIASSEPHPLEGIELTQDLARLEACLDGLEPQRRELVRSAYLDGASRDELSKRYGAPVATIKTWLHRSLAQLKACLTR